MWTLSLSSWLCILLCLVFPLAVASTSSLTIIGRSIPRGGGSGRSSATTGQQSTTGPLQTFAKTVMDARRHLVAAAVARSTSIFAMYPVDTIKVQIL